MGKQFDELSKALASGASRRAALKRFAVGLAGAALASVLPGRRAEAQYEPSDCRSICRNDLGLQGESFGRCVAACTSCIRNCGQFGAFSEISACIDQGGTLCFG